AVVDAAVARTLEHLCLLVPGNEEAEVRAGGVERGDVRLARFHEENRPPLEGLAIAVHPHHAERDRSRLVVGEIVQRRDRQPVLLASNGGREDRPAAEEGEDAPDDSHNPARDRAEKAATGTVGGESLCGHCGSRAPKGYHIRHLQLKETRDASTCLARCVDRSAGGWCRGADPGRL